MKRILFLMLAVCQCFWMTAAEKAPKWMSKAKNAVIAITTYDQSGKELRKGFGFYISETGEAVSSYELFKGAYKATVVSADGKTTEVKRIVGADELYDVLKFQVEEADKIAFLPVATMPQQNGAEVYRLAYTQEKKPVYVTGKIVEVSKLKDPYKYYKLEMPMETGDSYLPLLNAEGEVFGLTQADAGGDKTLSYGLSAGFANSLAVSSNSLLNSTYTAIGIRKCWPKDVEESSVALYLMASMQQPDDYTASIKDFIETFPESSEGYMVLSNHYAFNRKLLSDKEAEQKEFLSKSLVELKNASRYFEGKGEFDYNRAKLIFGVATSDTTLTDPEWTIEASMKYLDQAIEKENNPVYHQLRGDILYVQKKFEEAYQEYMIINNSDKALPSTYYWASKAKQNVPGFNIGEVVSLLDSAIVKCNTAMSAEAANYVLERIDWRLRLSQFKEAVDDYDLYLKLMNGNVAPNFYYLRAQAKEYKRDYAGALQDIQMAIAADPNSADYYAVEASLNIIAKKYDEALLSINNALRLNPEFAACYRLKGVCYLRLQNKEKGLEALQKAKEMGDPLAGKLIEQNNKK